MLLWPHTDSPISRNAEASKRLCSWAGKGRAGAWRGGEKGTWSHSLPGLSCSLRLRSRLHWYASVRSRGVTHRTHWSAKLICSPRRDTGQRAGRARAQSAPPHPTTPLFNSEQCARSPPTCHFPASQGGQDPHICWWTRLFWNNACLQTPPFYNSHCFLHLEGNVLIGNLPPSISECKNDLPPLFLCPGSKTLVHLKFLFFIFFCTCWFHLASMHYSKSNKTINFI